MTTILIGEKKHRLEVLAISSAPGDGVALEVRVTFGDFENAHTFKNVGNDPAGFLARISDHYVLGKFLGHSATSPCFQQTQSKLLEALFDLGSEGAIQAADAGLGRDEIIFEARRIEANEAIDEVERVQRIIHFAVEHHIVPFEIARTCVTRVPSRLARQFIEEFWEPAREQMASIEIDCMTLDEALSFQSEPC